MSGEREGWSQIVITYPGWGGGRILATSSQEMTAENGSGFVGNDMQWTTGRLKLVDLKETGCGK